MPAKKEAVAMHDETATPQTNDDPFAPDAEQEEVIRMSVEDLPGVGPATAEKLKEAGFEDLMAIAVASPSDLAEQCDIGEGVARKSSTPPANLLTSAASKPDWK